MQNIVLSSILENPQPKYALLYSKCYKNAMRFNSVVTQDLSELLQIICERLNKIRKGNKNLHHFLH